MVIWDSKSFYNPHRHADDEINRIVQCYDVKEIDKLIESTISYLKLVEKVQGACQQLLSAAYYHRGHVEETNVSYKVYFKRSSYRGSKVKYYTGVYIIPRIPNGDKYKYDIEHKQWLGKERHTAKRAAEELSRKYNCDIVNV